MWGLLAGLLIETSAFGAAPTSTYEQIVSELKSGFTDVDYRKLREAYSESTGYDPYFQTSKQMLLARAMKATDCESVLSLANALLAGNFTDIEAHIFAADCARRMHDDSTARFHLEVARGLLSSIAGSGDGKSAETAFVVVAVDEEYAWLFSQGYRVRNQALVKNGVHQLDAVDVFDQSGVQKTIYFNVDHLAAWLARKLPSQSGNTSGSDQH
jgi:hypothetical protein